MLVPHLLKWLHQLAGCFFLQVSFAQYFQFRYRFLFFSIKKFPAEALSDRACRPSVVRYHLFRMLWYLFTRWRLRYCDISLPCQPRSSRRASPSSQQLWSAGFFCGRPCDMELVTRQSERSGHQQRLLQAFTEDVFYFQLTRVRNALELSGRCALQIYLLTYLLYVVKRF